MKKIFSGVVLAVLVTGSIAQTASGNGFYLGAGVGLSKLDNQTGEFNSAMVSNFGGSITTTQDKSVKNFRLVGGFKVNENVALEVGYMDTSKAKLNFAGRSGGNVAYSGGLNVAFSGPDLAAVLRPSKASGYNEFFALVGAHNYKTKVSGSFVVNGTTYSANTSESGTGTMFGVGYDWKFRNGSDLRFGLARLNKIGGDSDVKTTNYGLTLIQHF